MRHPLTGLIYEIFNAQEYTLMLLTYRLSETKNAGLSACILSKIYHFLFTYRIHYSFKGLRVIHGQIGQNFATEFYIVLMNFSHENGIRHSILTCSSINTLNPQAPEISLFGTAVTIGILLPFFIGIFCNRPNIFSSPELALNQF